MTTYYLYATEGLVAETPGCNLHDRDHIQRMPAKIVAASDPFSHSASIYPGSQEWGKVWPAAMNGSITVTEAMELNKASPAHNKKGTPHCP